LQLPLPPPIAPRTPPIPENRRAAGREKSGGVCPAWAAILKSRSFLESTVPAPMRLPRRGNHRQEILSLQAVGRHSQIRGSVFRCPDPVRSSGRVSMEIVDIFAPRSKICNLRLCKGPTVPLVTSLFVGPVIFKSVLSVARRQGGAFREMNPERRQEGLEVLRRHVSPFQLDVNDRGLAPRDSYVPLRRAAALPIFSVEGFKTPTFLAQIVFGIEVHNDGNTGGRSAGNQQRPWENLTLPLVSASPPFDSSVPSRSTMPPSSHRGIEETRRREIQRADIEFSR